MKNKTRTTAARLERFKEADHWSQRRVEEGFAACVECIAENARAIREATRDDLSRCCGREWPEPPNMTPYYIAVLVLCALLILDGLLAHWGFVDYGPAIK